MEPGIVVSLVPTITGLPMTGEWRAHQAADCRARDGIARAVVSGRNWIDRPVVAPRVIAGYGVASDLDVGGFRCRGLGPIGRHIDPEFVPIRIKEMHDRRTLKGLAGCHDEHTVAKHRAFNLDVSDYILSGEWRIWNCRPAVCNLYRIGETD